MSPTFRARPTICRERTTTITTTHARPRAAAARVLPLAAALLLLAVAGTGCAPKTVPIEYTVYPLDHTHRDISKVWVEPFKVSARGTSGDQVAMAVRAAVGEEGLVQVIESPDAYRITGHIAQVSVDTNQWDDSWQDKDGKSHYSYHVRKKGVINGSYELWQGKQMICGGNLSASFDRQADSGAGYGQAAAGLPGDAEVINSLILELAEDIKHRTIPHKHVARVELPPVNHPASKQGIMYLQNGEPNDALTQFAQAAEDVRCPPNEKAGALYLSGVCHEMNGQYERAEDCYDQARLADPKPLYIQARQRAHKAIDTMRMVSGPPDPIEVRRGE